MSFEDYLKRIGLFETEGLSDFKFDLQYFGEAEEEGRTEEPTEHKKKKAKEEGNVPKSQELVGIIVFLLTFWTIALLSNYILEGLIAILYYFFENLNEIHITDGGVIPLYVDFLFMVGRVVLPIMVVGVVSALLANVMQTGLIFSTKKISLDFSKIFGNVGKNLKKMFFSGETFFNLFKSLLKVVGVFGIAFLMAYAHLSDLIKIARLTPMESMAIIANLIFKFVSVTGVMLLVFAIGDFAFQKWQHKQSLKMSKQELKEEYKEMEGNPEIKAKIKEMERQIVNKKKMLKDVPTADVVITNPTHFAVALKYDSSHMQAPTVIAKGEDAFARQIKKIAKENKVPIIENKPLARELYRRVEVRQEIPGDMFFSVANILKTVYSMKSTVAA